MPKRIIGKPICPRCEEGIRAKGQAYCASCRSTYMRAYRAKKVPEAKTYRKDGKCPMCAKRKRIKFLGYCRPCNAEKSAAYREKKKLAEEA